MKGLLIDVHNARIQEVEVSELDDYYKWIGCENIDITSRKIGGRIYDIICDDEGFFHEPVLNSLYGSGETTGLGNQIYQWKGEQNTVLQMTAFSKNDEKATVILSVASFEYSVGS